MSGETRFGVRSERLPPPGDAPLLSPGEKASFPAAGGVLPPARGTPAPQEAREPLIIAAGLCIRFGRRTVLAGAQLDVLPGEVLGLCGENGAGKTTLLRILAGLRRPQAGVVVSLGTVGYAPQVPLLHDHLTVREHFRYFAAARRLPEDTWVERSDRLLDFFRFRPWHHALAGTLSEGTKQKLNLALALLSDPDALLLDEPYSGFEWETYLRFWEYVEVARARGKAVVVVSHLFHDRARLDRVLELRNGALREAT